MAQTQSGIQCQLEARELTKRGAKKKNQRSSAQGSDNPQPPSARVSQHKLPNKADLSNASKAVKKGKSEAVQAKESTELPDCLARYFSDKEFDKAIQESK